LWLLTQAKVDNAALARKYSLSLALDLKRLDTHDLKQLIQSYSIVSGSWVLIHFLCNTSMLLHRLTWLKDTLK